MPDDTAPDLAILLAAIQADPDDGARWLALAWWYWDNGRDDEAVAVRVFWPVLRDNLTELGVSLQATLRDLERHAAKLGRRARQVEAARDCLPANGPAALPSGTGPCALRPGLSSSG